MVPFYAQVEETPEYVANTTAEVSTDNFYWVSRMIGAMADEDSELLSIYYGSDVEEEKANALVEAVQAAYPDFEVEAHAGGQPIYYYILSLE